MIKSQYLNKIKHTKGSGSSVYKYLKKFVDKCDNVPDDSDLEDLTIIYNKYNNSFYVSMDKVIFYGRELGIITEAIFFKYMTRTFTMTRLSTGKLSFASR